MSMNQTGMLMRCQLLIILHYVPNTPTPVSCGQHSSVTRENSQVALLLVANPLSDTTLHCTVVPLFTGVAGTVRVDCTVPDDVIGVSGVIPRSTMIESVAKDPSTIHAIVKPLPVQWNRAFSPTSALTDTGPSVRPLTLYMLTISCSLELAVVVDSGTGCTA